MGTVQMITEIQNLLDDYMVWLKNKTHLRQVDQWVEITTPYLDRHNDRILIYARQFNGGYTLTDDGYTINDLELSGCRLNSPKRQELLRTALYQLTQLNFERALSMRFSISILFFRLALLLVFLHAFYRAYIFFKTGKHWEFWDYYSHHPAHLVFALVFSVALTGLIARVNSRKAKKG